MFANLQETRLLDDEVAERVKAFMSFYRFFDHRIVCSESNLGSSGNGGICAGAEYSDFLDIS